MGRLYRPHIPLSVRCDVLLRQVAEPFPAATLELYRGKMGLLVTILMTRLAKKLGCEIKDLRLDHDPPLGARPRHRRGLNPKTFYTPDANDPDHLFYRPHGAQFAGSHDVKTRIRGDHGQFSDIALIKRGRRRDRKKTAQKPASRKVNFPGPKSAVRKKYRWPKRPFQRRKP